MEATEEQQLELAKAAVLEDVLRSELSALPLNVVSEAPQLAALVEAVQVMRAELARSLHSISVPAGPAQAVTATACGVDAWLLGDTSSVLGVTADALLEQAPNHEAVQLAVQAALPAVEAALLRRCKLVAASAGYDGSDFTGLADSVRQLSAAVPSHTGQTEGWQRAGAAAQRATKALSAAGESIATVLSKHTLGGQREADAARCAALQARAQRYAAKLALVAAQLRAGTYTAATLPALRSAAAHLSKALAQRRDLARQRAALLQQCQALGPAFERLAAAHAVQKQQLADAEYELGELEKYQQLARVLG